MTSKANTITVTSNRNRDSAALTLTIGADGVPTALALSGAGDSDSAVTVGTGAWVDGVVGIVQRMQATQVSTDAGSARYANRLAGGALRRLAPNGRHWTGPDFSAE